MLKDSVEQTEPRTIDTPSLDRAAEIARSLMDGAAEVIRGKKPFLELLIAAAFAGGHVLIEDAPGLGKTTVAKTLAQLIGDDEGQSLSFKRIQFTPDLLPYDITGVDVFDPQTKLFRFVQGPIFANIVLADEINRSTPKVQSALLEVMAENQVTVGTTTHSTSDPFLVIATQNPVESEGTFPLPAAQLDRFMLRLSLGYPDKRSELSILEDDPADTRLPFLEPCISISDFIFVRNLAKTVFCHPLLKEAIVDLSRKTRTHKGISLGLSPRASLQLLKASRALALIRGRDYVSDSDLNDLAVPSLAHRIKLRDPRLRAEELIREAALERINALELH
ncbi:MoxR family ATPase [Treponema sp.]